MRSATKMNDPEDEDDEIEREIREALDKLELDDDKSDSATITSDVEGIAVDKSSDNDNEVDDSIVAAYRSRIENRLHQLQSDLQECDLLLEEINTSRTTVQPVLLSSAELPHSNDADAAVPAVNTSENENETVIPSDELIEQKPTEATSRSPVIAVAGKLEQVESEATLQFSSISLTKFDDEERQREEETQKQVQDLHKEMNDKLQLRLAELERLKNTVETEAKTQTVNYVPNSSRNEKTIELTSRPATAVSQSNSATSTSPSEENRWRLTADVIYSFWRAYSVRKLCKVEIEKAMKTTNEESVEASPAPVIKSEPELAVKVELEQPVSVTLQKTANETSTVSKPPDMTNRSEVDGNSALPASQQTQPQLQAQPTSAGKKPPLPKGKKQQPKTTTGNQNGETVSAQSKATAVGSPNKQETPKAVSAEATTDTASQNGKKSARPSSVKAKPATVAPAPTQPASLTTDKNEQVQKVVEPVQVKPDQSSLPLVTTAPTNRSEPTQSVVEPTEVKPDQSSLPLVTTAPTSRSEPTQSVVESLQMKPDQSSVPLVTNRANDQSQTSARVQEKDKTSARLAHSQTEAFNNYSKSVEKRMKWMQSAPSWRMSKVKLKELKRAAVAKTVTTDPPVTVQPNSAFCNLLVLSLDGSSLQSASTQVASLCCGSDSFDFQKLSLCQSLRVLQLRNFSTRMKLTNADCRLLSRHLRVLDISMNALEDVQIENLPRLVYVNVSNNRLKGVPNLHGCWLVRMLDVSYNRMTRLDVPLLPNLHTLNVSNNQLITVSAFHNVQTLQRLDMSNNHLSSLQQLETLSLLQVLDASSNDLRQLPRLYNCPLLMRLNLSANWSLECSQACSTTSTETNWLPCLVSVDFSKCPFKDDCLSEYFECCNLKSVDFSNTELQDASKLLAFLRQHTELKRIVITDSPISTLLSNEKLVSRNSALVALSEALKTANSPSKSAVDAAPVRTAALHEQFQSAIRNFTEQAEDVENQLQSAIDRLKSLSDEQFWFDTETLHFLFRKSQRLAEAARQKHELGIVGESFESEPAPTADGNQAAAAAVIQAAFRGCKQRKGDQTAEADEAVATPVPPQAELEPEAEAEAEVEVEVEVVASDVKQQTDSVEVAEADEDELEQFYNELLDQDEPQLPDIDIDAIGSFKDYEMSIALEQRRIFFSKQADPLVTAVGTNAKPAWTEANEFVPSGNNTQRKTLTGSEQSEPNTTRSSSAPVASVRLEAAPRAVDWRLQATGALAQPSTSGDILADSSASLMRMQAFDGDLRTPSRLSNIESIVSANSAVSNADKKAKALASEWGFANPEVAQAALKRAYKLKYHSENKQKLKKLDAHQRLELSRRLEKQDSEKLVYHALSRKPRDAVPARTLDDERLRQREREREREQDSSSGYAQRTFEWVHTQVQGFPEARKAEFELPPIGHFCTVSPGHKAAAKK